MSGNLVLDRRKVRLFEASKKIGWSTRVIVSLLKEAKFYVPSNSSLSFLNSAQIDVLSSYYVDGVKRLFKYYKKNYFENSNVENEKLIRFLSLFINSSVYPNSYITIEEVLESELDENLIKDFFYTVIYSEPKSLKRGNNFYYINKNILSRIISKITKKDKDLRAKLSPILISNNYHIFTSEEDHFRDAKSFFRFSFVDKLIREALINYFTYLKHFSWKNTNYL